MKSGILHPCVLSSVGVPFLLMHVPRSAWMYILVLWWYIAKVPRMSNMPVIVLGSWNVCCVIVFDRFWRYSGFCWHTLIRRCWWKFSHCCLYCCSSCISLGVLPM